MRLAKQLLYGIGFLIFFSAFVWILISLLFPSQPSCFDGKRNQGEEGIDCGGPCLSCEIKSLKNIEVKFTKVFRAGNGVGVVAEIYNPNPGWGAKQFDYLLTLKNSLGVPVKSFEGKSFIYAGDLKYLVKPFIEVNPEEVISAELEIKNPFWVSLEQFEKPEIQVSEVKTFKENFLYVTGKANNKSHYDFRSANVYALIFNKEGELLAGSLTVIDQLPKFESREFSIPFSKDWEIYQLTTLDFSSFFPRSLKIGDSGEDVSFLQSLLLETKAIDRQPTGYFDSLTSQALMTLQNNLGIPASGEFDDLTRQTVINLLSGQIKKISQAREKLQVDPAKTRVFVEVNY
ncbi:MAG: hypothetical protein KatS3mg098_005 [Candidatus Parcubacteria bacterium]|nr:peptidoglycan-binding protein [Patescibacteria group bacterium]BCX15776.1 MAG: hypothetical protein KatS3mg098_005 [Candidatus Parcubacteria bacterium]